MLCVLFGGRSTSEFREWEVVIVCRTIVQPAHGATVLSTQFSVSMELWKSFGNKEDSLYIVATLQSLLLV